MKTVVASTKNRDFGSVDLWLSGLRHRSANAGAATSVGSKPTKSSNFTEREYSENRARCEGEFYRAVKNISRCGLAWFRPPLLESGHLRRFKSCHLDQLRKMRYAECVLCGRSNDGSCVRLKSGGCWCNPNCSHHYLRFRQYPMGGHFTFNFLQRALTQASVTLKEAAISISGICHTRVVSPSNGMLNFLRLSPVISFACFRQKRALECTFLKQVRQLFIDFLCVGEFRVLSEWQLEHRMTRFSKRLSEWSLLMWSNSRGAASPSHSEIPHFSQHLALIPNWIKRSLTVQDLRGQSFFRVSKNDSFVIWEKV